MIRGRLRPLTKNATNGTYVKYYPSEAFLPSVALGAILTTNIFLVIRGLRVQRVQKGRKYNPLIPFNTLLPFITLSAL